MLRDKDYLTILGLFILGLIVQKFSFPETLIHPTHIDEIAVVETAYNIYRGEYNPGFFRYPAGYMNILAFLFKMASLFTDDITIKGAYKIASFVSSLIIAFIPIMVFIVCYFLGNYIIGLVGSLLAIFSKIMIQHSQVAVVDVPLTFFCFLLFTISVYWYKNLNISLKKLIFLSSLVGISVAMKYTGAIIFVSLCLIIKMFINNNPNFAGTKSFQITFTLSLGFGLLLISSIPLAGKASLFQELSNLTTDGILEIEYHHLLDKLTYLSLCIGFSSIFLSYLIHINKINGLGNFISPLYLKSLIIVFIGFFVFSPFTILEIKKSFPDFMYEYRHMQIGSAAQYHHESQEYKSLVQNLDKLYPFRFYLKLFFYNFGKAGLTMAIVGVFWMLGKGKYVGKTMLAFLLIMIFTICGWQNVAERYTLSILPIIYVLIPFGIHCLSSFSTKMALPYYFSFALLSFFTFIETILKWVNSIG